MVDEGSASAGVYSRIANGPCGPSITRSRIAAISGPGPASLAASRSWRARWRSTGSSWAGGPPTASPASTTASTSGESNRSRDGICTKPIDID